MKLNVAITNEEASEIIKNYLASTYNMSVNDIHVVIGDYDKYMNNLAESRKKERANVIEIMKQYIAIEQKINAIKAFRSYTNATLKTAKFFTESPDKWQHYIESGEFDVFV